MVLDLIGGDKGFIGKKGLKIAEKVFGAGPVKSLIVEHATQHAQQ
jgi:hypothetical protein